jgi:hypothetical protein
MNDPLAVKVRIRNSAGRYLTGGSANSGFCADPAKAIIFDYLRHHIAEQIDEIRRTRGIFLEAVPVEPAEVYESCDQCGQLAAPLGIFFDGARFLCFECLAQSSLIHQAKQPTAASVFQTTSSKA